MSGRSYSKFQVLVKYLKYLVLSSNGKGHGIHSPFVFDFITKVLNGKTSNDTQFRIIEKDRRAFSNAQDILPDEDFGAGSSMITKNKSVASICRNALKSPKYARLLYRIVLYYRPDSILELGTSLGITTQYLSAGRPEAKLITIEGSPAIASIAQKGFTKNKCHQITLIVGEFSGVLDQALSRMEGKKFFYVDGDHRFGATMHYFNEIMKLCTDDDILVFDDIHWSKDMEKAWTEIKQDKRVRCTIDLFFIGLVFLKNNFLEKQNFMVRF